jgi:hypothetical protein
MAAPDPSPSPATMPAAPATAASAAAAPSAKVTAADAPYVTRPTRLTTFTRTFVPWQLWRFARINLKMIQIIRSGRHSPAERGRPGGPRRT